MGPRILLVIGDPSLARELARRLEDCGARVDLTTDGTAAVALATSSPPDLVVCAVELSGTSGFIVTKKLRSHPATAKVPIALLSSGLSEDVLARHRRLRTRADAYLPLPASIETILAGLGALVSLRPRITLG